MQRQGKLVRGIILGAGAMYLLDPDRGPRRRSLLRDQIVRAGNKLGDGLSATARDTRNRTVGAAASFRSRFREEEAEDDVLQERVRSAIGRLVSHPGAIEVTASDGRVTLRGDVLTEELNRLIKGVERVRGVKEVRNALAIHSSADGVPALQGQGRPREQRPELLQDNWAPAVRLAMGTLGGWMAFKGLRTRGLPGRALTPIGLGLLTRAVTNRSTRRLVGAGAGRRAVHIQKTIRVAAPVERVWELWSRFEQFPRFMSHLREVLRIDQNRSHWVASGPGGIPVEWDATVTEWLPHELIAWKSVEGSPVETAGRVQFRPTPDGQTEIDVHLSYNPPIGTLGHVVASLFGTDPKHAMDEDLVRLKSLLEDGKTRAQGESVGGKAGGFP
ncbi:MAG TPA: SRPBCC family protein [Gemmatimonadales bacterium]|nr:SRPBCC family protein [Gemmatimonadales bacterium]